MKNKEKYFDELIDIVKGECTGSLQKFKRSVMPKGSKCREISCQECEERFNEWLEQEYIEPIELTGVEIILLKNISKDYKWFSKDGCCLFVTYAKPYLDDGEWETENGDCLSFDMYEHLFKTLEKHVAYNIDELLKQYGVAR